MAPRTVQADPDAWQRLAKIVNDRRLDLGLTQADAVALSGGGISLAVWSIVENARQDSDAMGLRTLRGLAKALSWTPDSPAAVLAGGEPTVLEASEVDAVLRAVAESPHLDEAGRDAVRRTYLVAKANPHEPRDGQQR